MHTVGQPLQPQSLSRLNQYTNIHPQIQLPQVGVQQFGLQQLNIQHNGIQHIGKQPIQKIPINGPQFLPLSAQLSVQQCQQIPIQYSVPIQHTNQQQFAIQNVIQSLPQQIQYQIQKPPVQLIEPPKIEKQVDFIPQKKQIVRYDEQEIEEIVPVERKIIQYIPVQTIIEKEPVLVEIPYEIQVPKPYQQELFYPKQSDLYLDQDGNPIGNPHLSPDDFNKPKQQLDPSIDITQQIQIGSGEEAEEQLINQQLEQTEDEDEQLEILWTKQRVITEKIEEIKNKKRRKRRHHKNRNTSDDDFNFDKFEEQYGDSGRSGYRNYGSKYDNGYGYESRYRDDGYGESYGRGYGNRYRDEGRSRFREDNYYGDRQRGYHGKEKSARDYL